MIELINKFISNKDKETISSITNYNFNELINSVNNWGEYKNNKKHVVSKLDIKGMHLLRCILAERIINYKRKKIGNPIYKEYLDFEEKGIILINNFNPKKDYEKYKILLRYIVGNSNLNPSTPTSKREDSFGYDIQHTMHVDTFHSSIKVFKYGNKVKKDNGPFSYVLGSHKNTIGKLKILYGLSCRRSEGILNQELTREKNHEKWTDSFRLDLGKNNIISEEKINNNLNSYGLNSEFLIEGEKDTLIITDTSGFHRKYPCKQGFKRITKV